MFIPAPYLHIVKVVPKSPEAVLCFSTNMMFKYFHNQRRKFLLYPFWLLPHLTQANPSKPNRQVEALQNLILQEFLTCIGRESGDESSQNSLSRNFVLSFSKAADYFPPRKNHTFLLADPQNRSAPGGAFPSTPGVDSTCSGVVSLLALLVLVLPIQGKTRSYQMRLGTDRFDSSSGITLAHNLRQRGTLGSPL